MSHADPDRAACAGLPTIFESRLLVDHKIAARYCLGDNDKPACPIFDWCKENTPGREGYHDGTWAAVLFKKGREIARNGKAPKAGRAVA